MEPGDQHSMQQCVQPCFWLPIFTILMFHCRPHSCGMALIIAMICLTGMQSYCVQGSNPCTTIYQAQSGSYCSEIETQFGITSAQLTSLNPWLDSNCGKRLWPLFTYTLHLDNAGIQIFRLDKISVSLGPLRRRLSRLPLHLRRQPRQR